MKTFKADFHNHSINSYDGGISLKEYKKILDQNILDYIAITDHNRIDFALNAKKEFGDKIIIGEEISSKAGDIIGLFLKNKIPAGLTAKDTVKEIKEQKGYVYIPHPFDRIRYGIGMEICLEILENIDFFEIFNSRCLIKNFNQDAAIFAKKYKLIPISGSDSHSSAEMGRTYNIISTEINYNNFKDTLTEAKFENKYTKFFHRFAPKINKLKKKIKNNG